jgi:hypothetical protein
MSAIKQTSATKWFVKRVYNIFSILHIRVGNAGK